MLPGFVRSYGMHPPSAVHKAPAADSSNGNTGMDYPNHRMAPCAGLCQPSAPSCHQRSVWALKASEMILGCASRRGWPQWKALFLWRHQRHTVRQYPRRLFIQGHTSLLQVKPAITQVHLYFLAGSVFRAGGILVTPPLFPAS